MKEAFYGPGEVVCRFDEADLKLCIIICGDVEFSVHNYKHNEYKLGTLQVKHFF